jgi:hypothetical protein
MDDEDRMIEDALFADLRAMWQEADPVPVDLVDRMVAAVAVADLPREYALLTLVEAPTLDAVRSAADTATLQFSDGRTTVLLHVTVTPGGSRRIDGWVHAGALALRLLQDERDWTAHPGEHGRFVFEPVPRGVSRLRIVVRDADGQLREFQTPQFEL